MFGGSVDPEAAELDDDELIDLTCQELRRTVGIDAEPVFTSIGPLASRHPPVRPRPSAKGSQNRGRLG